MSVRVLKVTQVAGDLVLLEAMRISNCFNVCDHWRCCCHLFLFCIRCSQELKVVKVVLLIADPLQWSQSYLQHQRTDCRLNGRAWSTYILPDRKNRSTIVFHLLAWCELETREIGHVKLGPTICPAIDGCQWQLDCNWRLMVVRGHLQLSVVLHQQSFNMNGDRTPMPSHSRGNCLVDYKLQEILNV